MKKQLILCLLALGFWGVSAVGASSALDGNVDDLLSADEVAKAELSIQKEFSDAKTPEQLTAADQKQSLDQFQHLDPKALVPSDLLQAAVLYLAQNQSKFKNQSYMGVVDYKPRSDQYRFYLINLQTGEVEPYHTTHGAGSDPKETGYAEKFSNVIGSNMSSLGYARTAEVYTGRFGVSMRLDGLSKTNSNIRARSVVFHGWDQVHEANVIEGLSDGCIAFDYKVKDSLIDRLKGGALIYFGVAAQ